MKRPPKFVQGFIDRHGKPRFYFRRRRLQECAVAGTAMVAEFMAAYEAALAGQPMQIGSARVKPGTFRALAVSYFNSTGFRSMKPSTQSVYRNAIERLLQERQKAAVGDKGAATMQREHVVKLMAAKAEKPESANLLRKVLRAMMTARGRDRLAR